MRQQIISITLIVIFSGLSCSAVQAQNRKKTPPPAKAPVQLNMFNINKWVGSWERRIWQQDAKLEIENISGNSFSFDLSAVSGSLGWEAKGRAYLQDNHTAIFTSPLHSGCKLTIRLLSDSVIQIDGGHCDAYGSKEVSYTGRFGNSKYLPKKGVVTMLSLHILNKPQNDALTKLLGEWYDGFMALTQHTTKQKPQKPSTNGLRIISATRSGLEGKAEYILMVDNANHIWTAILSAGENILYFTNTNDKKTLPQPIEQWRKHFAKKYPIVYK